MSDVFFYQFHECNCKWHLARTEGERVARSRLALTLAQSALRRHSRWVKNVNMRLQIPKTKSFPKPFVRFAFVGLGTTTSTRTQRSCGEGEEKMEKNESSGGEAMQRVYSAIGGVPGAGESPRTAGWQVGKWLLSALLLLLLLPFLLLL